MLNSRIINLRLIAIWTPIPSVNILKASINEPSKLSHQVYDMLFLLFEIAFEFNIDIDSEWTHFMIKCSGRFEVTNFG